MSRAQTSRSRETESRAAWAALVLIAAAWVGAACGDVAGEAIRLVGAIDGAAGIGAAPSVGGSGAAGDGAAGAAVPGGAAGAGGAGAASGGGVADGGDGGSTGGTTSTAECRLALYGATGDELDGLIPVCCALPAADQASAEEVIFRMNELRAASGLTELAQDALLEETAQGHCMHMATHPFFSDTAPEAAVSSLGARATLCGTSALGEIIGRGYSSAESLVNGWASGGDTRDLMLGTRWTRVGVGRYDQYWGALLY